MTQKWKEFTSGDRLIVRPLYKYPVATAAEMKLLFDYFEDYSQVKIALGLILYQGLRPSEIAPLTWKRFTFDESKNAFTEMTHVVYKPTNRKTSTGTNYYYKELRKPIYSKWLSDQLIGYSKKCKRYDNDKVFAWSTPDTLKKYFYQLRKDVTDKKLSPDYDFMLDETFDVICGGNNLKKYRVSVYALRRFCFTFNYYVTFKKDFVALSKAFGHSRPETCLNHYILPKEAIGLTDELIEQGITIDEFINSQIANQTIISDFELAEMKPRFMQKGQRTLGDYRFMSDKAQI